MSQLQITDHTHDTGRQNTKHRNQYNSKNTIEPFKMNGISHRYQ